MRIAITEIESVSDYGQSRGYEKEVPHLDKEIPVDYEERTWRNRLHTDEKGEVFIPPMAFKNCIAECAKYLSKQIPGKGKNTYTKHFEAGIQVMPEPIFIGINSKDVEPLWLFVPSDGRRGGPKRVWKCFPVIRHWKATVTWYILDETITEKVFEEHLSEAGKFIGVGFFRPRNNGYFGRYKTNSIKWEESA